MTDNLVQSTLELYRSVSSDRFNIKGWSHLDHRLDKIVPVIKVEDLYKEYERVINNNILKYSLRDVRETDIKEISFLLENSGYNSNEGLFLSALFNNCNLKKMKGKFNFKYLGYRLHPSKELTIEAGSNIDNLGHHCEGNITNCEDSNCEVMAEYAMRGVQINYGRCHVLASQARGGVQVNYGEATSISSCANNGIQLNRGDTDYFANGVLGGLQINFGYVFKNSFEPVGSFASYSRGGLQINFGEIFGSLASESAGGVQINFGEVKGYSYDDHYRETGCSMGHRAGENTAINRGLVLTLNDKGAINFGRVVYPRKDEHSNNHRAVEELRNGSPLEIMLNQLSDWDKLEGSNEKIINFFKRIDCPKLEQDLKKATELYLGEGL